MAIKRPRKEEDKNHGASIVQNTIAALSTTLEDLKKRIKDLEEKQGPTP